MALNMVTLTGTLPAAAQALASFTPSSWLTDTTDTQLRPPVPVTVTLDDFGHFSVDLTATDNSGPVPAGWTWAVVFTQVPGVAPYGWSFSLPFSLGATQDISNIAPIAPTATYLPFQYPNGAHSGYVWTTDASGNGSWQPSSGGGGGAVASVFGRTGAVVAGSGDYSVGQVTGAAPLASPALTGTPTAPTAAPGADSTRVATTAYADAAVAVETSRAAAAETLLAPKASPALTGTPTAPTAIPLTDSTQIATTAYTDAAVTAGQPTTGSPLPLLKGGTGTSAASAGVLLDTLGALDASENLAELGNAATARTNLGLGSAATQPSSAFDVAGAAATETTRAEAAEAALLPLAGGTMSGAIAMGSHKITGLTNGSSAQDAAAFGQLPSSGTPLALTAGGTGVSESTDAALLAALGAAALTGATFTGALVPAVAALSQSAGTVAVNAALGNVFTLSLTASGWTISNPTNPADGQIIRIRLAQDSTGSRAVSWGTAYDWGSTGGVANSAPTLTTAASKVDVLAFEYDAAISKWCSLGAAFPQGF